MTIQSGDIKLAKSQVMDDVPEGGGAPIAAVVVDGSSNEIFPDISELDRAGGRVAMRKLFPSVRTPTVDGFFGANVIVADPPKDPRVSVTIFTTGDVFDTRASAQSRVEAYLNKGPDWNGYLYSDHIQGQRIIQLFQRPGSALPAVGQTIVLIQNEGLSTEVAQYVRATRVSHVEQTFTYSQGGTPTDFQAWVVSVEISDALRSDFKGSPPSRFFIRTTDGSSASTTTTKVRDTVVADASTYMGVVGLQAAAHAGDFTINAASIYTQLVPSAQTETPLADVNPMQQTVGYVPSGNTLAMSLTLAFSTTQSLYIGGAILPGSLSIVRSGITLTDLAGVLYNASAQVGTVDYENGIVALATNVFGTTGGTHAVTYTPAAVPRVFGPSLGVDVTAPTRSLSYVQTLGSVPAIGSLSISFQVSKQWYVLRDDGSGKLRGSAPSDGAGTINFSTGTVSVTLGSLPDVGSTIIYQWTPSLALNKVAAADLRNGAIFYAPLSLGQQVVPGSVSLSWNDGSARTASDSAVPGTLAGAASGAVTSAGVQFSPSSLPPAGTVVTANFSIYQSVVDTVSTTLAGTASGTNWVYSMPTSAAAGKRLSVRVYVNQHVEQIDGAWSSAVTPRAVTLFTIGDNGTTLYASMDSGGWSNPFAVGTVDWAAKTFTLNGTFNTAAFAHVYQNVGGVLYDQWSILSTKHDVPAGGTLTLVDQITVRSTVVVTGQTANFTVNAYQLKPTASASGGVGLAMATFALNGVTYRQGAVVGMSDKLYSAISPITGLGTQVGTIGTDGTVTLTTWTAGTPNSVSNWSAVWAPPQPGVNAPFYVRKLTFRSAAAPLRPASLTVLANDSAGNLLTGTSDTNGTLTGGITGTVDFENGVIKLSDAQTVDAATLRYNAVSYSYLPLDATLLGLDPVRLPSDGRVPIFREGGFVVVGHTASIGPVTVNNSQVIDCARVRLSRVRLLDANGVVLTNGYTVDLDLGLVTITDKTGWVQPVKIEHRIEDMMLVSQVQINGQLTFTRSVSHDYPLGSYVSSALVIGDMKARVSLVFDQQTWSNQWADTLIGSGILANFNVAQNPITVTNAGALTERWAVQFTNNTSFQVVGEHVGVIAVGNTGADCSPVNPATGAPYFTIPSAGWGLGWANGNVLRFNTIGAIAPVWCVRTVLQGPETVPDDSFTLLVRGDVDRP